MKAPLAKLAMKNTVEFVVRERVMIHNDDQQEAILPPAKIMCQTGHIS